MREAADAAWAEVGEGELTVNAAGARAAVPGGTETLMRVLRPVFENAARYGAPPVTLTAEASGVVVIITVESGGRVVPDSDVSLAFEAFYRGEAAVMSAPGLGLGLPIARILAEQAGGRVDMSARDGGGVAVRFELPAA